VKPHESTKLSTGSPERRKGRIRGTVWKGNKQEHATSGYGKRWQKNTRGKNHQKRVKKMRM
jgi:hypothetical protein